MSRVPTRRAKESFPRLLELAPVRLIGGFVCVDSHLGCAGCHFCLNRRYPVQRQVLERRIHRDWAEAGMPPEHLAALVSALPAVTRARVPIRFGHISDLVFQLDGAQALLGTLPPDRPVMLLTRFPPAAPVEDLLRAHPNALLHLSIAPPVAGAIGTDLAPERILAAAATLPAAQLFVMLGPLVEGSEEPVRRLLPTLPRGAAVGFKPLASEGVPFPIGVAPLGTAVASALAAEARALGLDVPPMAGCRPRARLGLPFFRHREVVDVSPRACDDCANRAVCAAVGEPSDEVLAEEAAILGLSVDGVRREPPGIRLEVTAPVARADEVYLSEKLGWPVFLSGVGRGGGFRVVEVSDQVLRRWERTGFYPATELAAAAARMAERCGIEP
jgi:hypothetical protein